MDGYAGVYEGPLVGGYRRTDSENFHSYMPTYARVQLMLSPASLHDLTCTQLVTGTDQGRVYRVCFQSLDSILVSENPSGTVACISYAPGVSDRFATASADGIVRIWDGVDYGVLAAAVVRDAGKPWCLVFTLVRLCPGQTTTIIMNGECSARTWFKCSQLKSTMRRVQIPACFSTHQSIVLVICRGKERLEWRKTPNQLSSLQS